MKVMQVDSYISTGIRGSRMSILFDFIAFWGGEEVVAMAMPTFPKSKCRRFQIELQSIL